MSFENRYIALSYYFLLRATRFFARRATFFITEKNNEKAIRYHVH